jgi:crotonobetainyl-CoA:carnitine CoA-transferase CaiB-like acyl-CoA transferase
MLPAVAVRPGPARAPRIPDVTGDARIDGARVVVVGFAWAGPLAGRVLQRLGAEVVRIVDPRRPDPFPLRATLAAGQREVALDLGDPSQRARAAALLSAADVLVDATTPRVLRNAGLAGLAATTVRIAAFADDDRPGYGIAAEARGGWGARHDPPRLGRASVADPVAGLLAAMTVVEVLRGAGSDAPRVSLESAVGHLLERERRRG